MTSDSQFDYWKQTCVKLLKNGFDASTITVIKVIKMQRRVCQLYYIDDHIYFVTECV